MTTKYSSLHVVWSAADGRDTALEPIVRIDVADGLSLSVAFELLGLAHVAVDLSLQGTSKPRDGGHPVPSRFVVIPTAGNSLLVGVAEESMDQANLTPTAATPRWARSDGESMPTPQGSVVARNQEGAGLLVALVPGPGGADACVLRVALVAAARSSHRTGFMAPALSVPTMSPGTLRIAAGPLT